jgi:formiminotetrahydrofolate cyclodeaminase
MYADLTVSQFLDALASKEPVPGGGSGAALAGALAAALVSMVCNLTIGKKGYEAVEREMQAILAESEAIRKELPQLLEASITRL